MKQIIFLISLFSTVCNAQIKQAEFDKTMGLMGSNNKAKALTTIESLEKKFPTDAKVFVLRGYYEIKDGNPNGALMNFSNAIKANPKYAFAYDARAQVFSKKGMLDKAILDANEAIEIEPKNIGFLKNRVGFYFHNKQYQEALDDVKAKIKLEPNNIYNYYDAADFTKDLDKNAVADFYFDQAYANKSIPKYLTDIQFASFLLKYGRFEEAKTKYETALVNNEKDFTDSNFHESAIVFYKTKNYDKAIIYFNKAIALNPNNVEYYNNLSSVYLTLKDWQKLIETAQKALNANDNSPIANMYMAIGLNNTGNSSKALEYQARAKRLDAEQNK